MGKVFVAIVLVAAGAVGWAMFGHRVESEANQARAQVVQTLESTADRIK
jgi:predicted negative regulator of RcsB-dependent stress response